MLLGGRFLYLQHSSETFHVLRITEKYIIISVHWSSYKVKKKVKQSHYRPGQAQRVPRS